MSNRFYNDLSLYQEALSVWERVGSARSTVSKPSASEHSQAVLIQPMPKPSQYNDFSHYQRALKSWFTVAQRLAQRAAVQPPPMPMPDDYNEMSHYNEAMQLWEQLFSK